MTAFAPAIDNPAAGRMVAAAITTPPAATSPVTATRVTLATARRRNPQQRVPSPCVGVCKMDAAKGWCAGCYRTIDELTAWSRATDATKLAVWSLVEQRQA